MMMHIHGYWAKVVLAVVFTVTWQTGMQYQATDCVGKQPAGIVCAKQIPSVASRVFKTEEAANEFAAILNEMKAEKVSVQINK